MRTNRIVSLDIARAISMLIILLYHSANYTDHFNGSWWYRNIAYVARWALGAFVLCSGYLIGSRYSFESGRAVLTFYTRRLVRILPLFALSAFVWHPPRPPVVSLAVVTGLINFINMPNVFTLWFVSMLIVFYVIAPLICRENILTSLIISAVFEALFLFGSHQFGWESRLSLYFPCFAIGIIAAKLKPSQQKHLVLSGAAIAILIWTLWPTQNASIFRPLFGSAAIICFSWVLGRSKALTKLFSFLAYSSMAAYLFHRQIFIFFRGILGFPQEGPTRAIHILLICIPTILLTGYAIQYTYDLALKRLSLMGKRGHQHKAH